MIAVMIVVPLPKQNWQSSVTTLCHNSRFYVPHPFLCLPTQSQVHLHNFYRIWQISVTFILQLAIIAIIATIESTNPRPLSINLCIYLPLDIIKFCWRQINLDSKIELIYYFLWFTQFHNFTISLYVNGFRLKVWHILFGQPSHCLYCSQRFYDKSKSEITFAHYSSVAKHVSSWYILYMISPILSYLSVSLTNLIQTTVPSLAAQVNNPL